MTTLRVKELRAAAGLSQAELARRAGINAKTIRKIEGGSHMPSLTTTIKLSEALGVSPLEMLAPA